MYRNIKYVAAAAVVISTLSAPASARDLSLVGSRTISVFAKVVAEKMVEKGFGQAEIGEVNTSQGYKHFCRGVGNLYPDMAMASRAIKDGEVEDCKAHGVEAFTEIKIGYDAVLFTHRADSGFGDMSLTRRQIWLAIGKTVPVNGAMVANPYRNWSDIDPSLPAAPIKLHLPEKGNGGRDLLSDLVLLKACEDEPAMASMSDDAREEACLAAREDGAILEFATSRDALVAMVEAADQPLALTNLQAINMSPEAKDAKIVKLEGVEPNTSTIASGEYEASRTYYLYVKNQHIGDIPGIVEYVTEFLSDDAQGPDGYLTKMGWMAPKDEEREEMLARIKSAASS
jgi:phosphate transport system substrate-binding protein